MSVILEKPSYYNQYQKLKFLRYPGGKNRLLKFLIPNLPNNIKIKGDYVEPFLGSGAVFFCINPKHAILSDINGELINLYRAIKSNPEQVWEIYKNFPKTKKFFYDIRTREVKSKFEKASKTLYLNRTCFKGMWRYNKEGEFNVGYGGQERRWVIACENLTEVSKRLRKTAIKKKDFEEIIDNCKKDDFIFLDPPYSAGKKETMDLHYHVNQFLFDDHLRLSKTLHRATKRGIKWAMTTSSHPHIRKLFHQYHIQKIPIGIGKNPGILTRNSGEILVQNYSKI